MPKRTKEVLFLFVLLVLGIGIFVFWATEIRKYREIAKANNLMQQQNKEAKLREKLARVEAALKKCSQRLKKYDQYRQYY